jgi:hypothetical protein
MSFNNIRLIYLSQQQKITYSLFFIWEPIFFHRILLFLRTKAVLVEAFGSNVPSLPTAMGWYKYHLLIVNSFAIQVGWKLIKSNIMSQTTRQLENGTLLYLQWVYYWHWLNVYIINYCTRSSCIQHSETSSTFDVRNDKRITNCLVSKW